MSKRQADSLAEQSISLPDDVLDIIFVNLLGHPKTRSFYDSFQENDSVRLKTYFRLPLVNSAFNRVISQQRVDWKSMILCSKDITNDVTKVFIYLEIELNRVDTQIHQIVKQENVTYRSPVQRKLSIGKLAFKKLRHATYPSAHVRKEVLDLLRQREKLCRNHCTMRKKYLR